MSTTFCMATACGIWLGGILRLTPIPTRLFIVNTSTEYPSGVFFLAKMKLSKKFTKMAILAIFRTGKIRVSKTAKNSIFVNFCRLVVGRHEPSLRVLPVCNFLLPNCNQIVTVL